jgi:uncharacterized protein YvpB
LRLQAWSLENKTDWKTDWENGHYVIAIGYDDKKIYFEDPWCATRSFLKYQELIDRWHDVDTDGKKYVNLGIVIKSQRKPDKLERPVHME